MLWYLLMWRELLSIGAPLHFSSQKMSICSILLLKKYWCCVFTYVKKFIRLEFVFMLLDVLLYVSWITFFLKWLDCVWNRLIQPNIGIIVYYCFIFRYSNLSCALDVLIVLLLYGSCRVNFRLKSDTNLFEIVKCKTSVSAIEVLCTHALLTFLVYCWI